MLCARRGAGAFLSIVERPSTFVRSLRNIRVAPRGGAATRPTKIVGPHHPVRTSRGATPFGENKPWGHTIR